MSVVCFGWLGVVGFKLAQNRSKQQRGGRIKGTPPYQEICFGQYGLQAMGSSWITARSLHNSLVLLGKRSKHPGRRIWPRIFPSKSVSARPLATRMGKGKGFPRCLVAVVKPGRILFEIGGVSEKIARSALKTASALLPVRTQFIASKTRWCWSSWIWEDDEVLVPRASEGWPPVACHSRTIHGFGLRVWSTENFKSRPAYNWSDVYNVWVC